MAVVIVLNQPCLIASAWTLDLCPNNLVKFSEEQFTSGPKRVINIFLKLNKYQLSGKYNVLASVQKSNT